MQHTTSWIPVPEKEDFRLCSQALSLDLKYTKRKITAKMSTITTETIIINVVVSVNAIPGETTGREIEDAWRLFW
jgi:hypothetical protein